MQANYVDKFPSPANESLRLVDVTVGEASPNTSRSLTPKVKFPCRPRATFKRSLKRETIAVFYGSEHYAKSMSLQ